MIKVAFTSVTDTREQLKDFHPKTAYCTCGRIKTSSDMVLCAHCARYTGPLVIVEQPDGKKVRECGLDSAEHEIEKHFALHGDRWLDGASK